MTRNEKNYEALVRLILVEFQFWSDSGYAAVDGRMAGRLASALVASGVLVPDALTDDEATGVPFDGEWTDGEWTATTDNVPEKAAEHRAALERIARGE